MGTCQIRGLWEENYYVYGKVWRQLQRDALEVARCTVVRLMRQVGICGVVRGKPAKTTVRDLALPCPADQVNRQFHAPRSRCVVGCRFHLRADTTGLRLRDVAIDVFARRIVGWQVSRSLRTDFVLNGWNKHCIGANAFAASR